MTEKVLADHLSGVACTLMYPVYARANETQMENPIIRDSHSVDMLEKINFDFSVFEKIPDKTGFSKKDMQTGIAVRTELLDNGVRSFLNQHPDGLVINMGCGLDARFFRLDNGSMQWIDIDLKEAIEIKKYFFKDSDRYEMMAASILDSDWLDNIKIKDNQATLLLAEGTLMYFTEEEVKALFNRLIEKFPNATLLFEVMGSALSGKVHPSVKCLQENVVCPWGIHDYKELENWSRKLKLIQSDMLIDHHRDRWSLSSRLMTWLFSRQKPKFAHAILHMEIQ